MSDVILRCESWFVRVDRAGWRPDVRTRSGRPSAKPAGIKTVAAWFACILSASIPGVASGEPTAATKVRPLTVYGFGGDVGELRVGRRVFSNRDYAWTDIPEPIAGWKFVRLPGGRKQFLRVRSPSDSAVYVATNGNIRPETNGGGWEAVEDVDLRTDAKGGSRMKLYRREVAGGETVKVPAAGFSGGIVMAPSLRLGNGLNRGKIPGTVLSHLPAADALYVGSPAIIRLDEPAAGRNLRATLLAAHDVFGRRLHDEGGETRLFRSTDGGETWEASGVLIGLTWANFFRHRGAVYLMGVRGGKKDVIIRRSNDGGRTWTTATDETDGVLRRGDYHTAPTPTVVHGGRVWRAMEIVGPRGMWPTRYRAAMMSADAGADLLRADAWTVSEPLNHDPDWFDPDKFERGETDGGGFLGWLEGNAVVDPRGGVANLLRVDAPIPGGRAALIRYDATGRTPSFDPGRDVIAMPGGCKKFTVRFDPVSRRYWSLTNAVDGDLAVPPALEKNRRAKKLGWVSAGKIRNVLTLISSDDLQDWRIEREVLRHDNVIRVGFQYADWDFDGDDLVAVSRTAHFDGISHAHNAHDANLLTFHRIRDFRHSPATK